MDHSAMNEKLGQQDREDRRKELEALAADHKRRANRHRLEYIIVERMRYDEGFITEKELAQNIDKANCGFF
jgi:hypothetical protein